MSLSFVLVMILSSVYFYEAITIPKAVGMGLIVGIIIGVKMKVYGFVTNVIVLVPIHCCCIFISDYYFRWRLFVREVTVEALQSIPFNKPFTGKN